MPHTSNPNIPVLEASKVSLPGNEDFLLFFNSENSLHLTGAKNINNVLTLVDYDAGGGGGASVNPTPGTLPINLAGIFADSLITQSSNNLNIAGTGFSASGVVSGTGGYTVLDDTRAALFYNNPTNDSSIQHTDLGTDLTSEGIITVNSEKVGNYARIITENNKINIDSLHINLSRLQEFADNAAALTGSLAPGDLYYSIDGTDWVIKIVHA